MHALVSCPLVLLDEVWAGMDEVWAGMDGGMICAGRAYLRGDSISDEQAVVVASHWEDEVLWVGDGVEKFSLEAGEGVVLPWRSDREGRARRARARRLPVMRSVRSGETLCPSLVFSVSGSTHDVSDFRKLT
jgi:hypothetical protein